MTQQRIDEFIYEVPNLRGKLFKLRVEVELFHLEKYYDAEKYDVPTPNVPVGTIVLATGRALDWREVNDGVVAQGFGEEYEVLADDDVGFLPAEDLEQIK